MKRITIENIKEKAAPILKDNDAAFAGVFGSYAKGEAGPESDIDILIAFSRSHSKSLLDLVRVEGLLSEALQKKVDLVTENSLSPYIRDNALSSLVSLYGER